MVIIGFLCCLVAAILEPLTFHRDLPRVFGLISLVVAFSGGVLIALAAHTS